LDFWIDQYDEDLNLALEVATKVSRAEYDKETLHKLTTLQFDPFTTAGLIKQFCELVVILDLRSLGKHSGEGLDEKLRTFLKRLRNSNFVEDDANILAAVLRYLARDDDHTLRVIDEEYGTDTDKRFRPKLVHTKIAWVARNLHPGIEDLYQHLS
jgi:hypothetical protein